MISTIRSKLEQMAEEPYRKFQNALCPNANMLGVRLPKLRKLAKKMVKENYRPFLELSEPLYFEEVMLQGMIIGYEQGEFHQILDDIRNFVPKIDNWSVCDSFCSGLKITRSHPEEIWNFLQPYLHSKQEFEVRFSLVMVLLYFIQEDKLSQIFGLFDFLWLHDYYAQMAAAWLLCSVFCKFPEKTQNFLEHSSLDTIVYQLTIKKIRESNVVSEAKKAEILNLK